MKLYVVLHASYAVISVMSGFWFCSWLVCRSSPLLKKQRSWEPSPTRRAVWSRTLRLPSRTLGTGYVRSFTTNDVGQFVAPGLPIGKYDLKAESSGFKIEESKGVILNVNDRIRVDFQMKMGTKSETVSVEANAISVQADSSEQSNLISGTQISQLATNGRSIYTYVTLTTGASNLMPDFQAPTPVGANAGISFNGNRPGHNLYLLDGGENADRGGAGASSVMPSVDAIAETQTLTSNYSADYGLSSGGTISSAVKSGTKEFHASAWEFFRNNALDARNYFNPAPQPVAELRYNVYGFNVGGPVTFGKLYNPNKTKTFFFYNMEWRDLIQGQTLNQTVPLTSTYGGDFRRWQHQGHHGAHHGSGFRRIIAKQLPGVESLHGCRTGVVQGRRRHLLR